MKIRTLLGPAAAVVARPSLWRTAVRQILRVARPNWWRKAPFLPLPPADYLGFRLQTQYGDADAKPVSADVLNYLRWVRRWDRAA